MDTTKQQVQTALVAEGGGQKGIFTAGVLDAFLECEFWPFDLKVGVSAGAQNLAAYCARARQYARSAIQELTTEATFFSPRKFFMGGNLIDLDWYFEQVQNHDKFRFPTDPSLLSEGANFYAVATELRTLKPFYLHTYHDNMFEHLKASSAIPFLYRPGVMLAGNILADGGVADPIPVKWAYQQGAKRIVVIRTVPLHNNGEVPMLERLKPILSRVKQSPRMMEMYSHYQLQYADAVNFMNNPPEGVEIIQIAPPDNLASMVLGSGVKPLQFDYLTGQRAGRSFARKHMEGW